ncbi:hypothetical protein GLOTRDRAFT_50507, partial [Gloeophyllum trabeum ATCC 11539]
MGGASGYLRQEFRELEILDHITKLRYDGLLPGHIQGHRRNTLVRAYQIWKKDDCPKHVHAAIKWSKTNPLQLTDYVEDAPWKLLTEKEKKRNQNNEIPGVTSTQIPKQPVKGISTLTEKATNDPLPESNIKKPNIPYDQIITQRQKQPIGFIWNSSYTCAYDAVLTIIYNLWAEKINKWNSKLKFNEILINLTANFNEIKNEQMTMEV